MLNALKTVTSIALSMMICGGNIEGSRVNAAETKPSESSIPVKISRQSTPINVTLPSSIEVVFNGESVEGVTASSYSITNNSGLGQIKVSNIKATAKDGWTLVSTSTNETFSSLPLDSKQLYLGLSTDKSEYRSLDNSEGIDPEISIGPNTGTPKAVSFYVRAKTGGMSEKVESGLVDLTFTIGYDNAETVNKLDLSSYEASHLGYLFNKLSDGTYSIGSPDITGDIIIPRTIDGIPVTKIADYGFSDNSYITSVVIPNAVTTIGRSAFESATGLTNVSIPDSVTTIGEQAFSDCRILQSIQIPDNVTKIEDRSFASCDNLNKISIPDSVTEIGEAAFEWSGLTSISISDSVTTIGEGAFYHCTSLTEISIDPNNLNYMSLDGVFFNKDMTTLIQYPAGKTDLSYTVPIKTTDNWVTGGVETINDYAFMNNKNLTEINISSRVKTIGNNAFNYCDNLITINVDNSKTMDSLSNWPWGAKNAKINWLQESPDIDLEIPLV